MQIGFIGLGSMGAAMARNLVKASHDVRAWNRSKVAQDNVPGVILVDRAADAFEADAVFTMLSDDPAIREVILDAGLLASAQQPEAEGAASCLATRRRRLFVVRRRRQSHAVRRRCARR